MVFVEIKSEQGKIIESQKVVNEQCNITIKAIPKSELPA